MIICILGCTRRDCVYIINIRYSVCRVKYLFIEWPASAPSTHIIALPDTHTDALEVKVTIPTTSCPWALPRVMLTWELAFRHALALLLSPHGEERPVASSISVPGHVTFRQFLCFLPTHSIDECDICRVYMVIIPYSRTGALRVLYSYSSQRLRRK